jgi:hypothetical protein
MVDFRNGREGQLWFQDQPDEVCVTLAARAALRVLPLIVAGEDRNLNFETVLALPCFRAAAASWAAAKYPQRRSEVYAAIAAAEKSGIHAYAASRAASAAARTIGESEMPII